MEKREETKGRNQTPHTERSQKEQVTMPPQAHTKEGNPLYPSRMYHK